MQISVSSYIPGSSAVHTCDARVKILLLLAYSITLFLVNTWSGLFLCTAVFAGVLALARLSPRRIFSLLLPVYILVAFTILFNGFALDAGSAAATLREGGLGDVSAGVFATAPPLTIVGSFGLVPAGFVRGCFYAARIILLVAASLIVTFTTTSTQLTEALASFLRPLRPLHIPVDDIAMVFSLALRFIPLTAEEFGRVHNAQQARGASFGEGGLVKRLGAWQTVMIPLFVGLFRRADTLAIAMDARCYGNPFATRTSLTKRHFGLRPVLILVVGLALCVTLSLLF